MSAAVALNDIPAPRIGRDEFERQVKAVRPKLVRLAFKLTRNYQDSEDLLATTVYKGWRNLHTFKEGHSFQNWMSRIMTNAFCDDVRLKKRRVTTVSYDAPLSVDGQDDMVQFEKADENVADPLESLVWDLFTDKMKAAMASLCHEHRSILVRCHVDGMSYIDIAAQDRCPEGSVRSRLHRARVALKEAYEKAPDEDRIYEPVEPVRAVALPDVPDRFEDVRPVQPLHEYAHTERESSPVIVPSKKAAYRPVPVDKRRNGANFKKPQRWIGATKVCLAAYHLRRGTDRQFVSDAFDGQAWKFDYVCRHFKEVIDKAVLVESDFQRELLVKQWFRENRDRLVAEGRGSFPRIDGSVQATVDAINAQIRREWAVR